MARNTKQEDLNAGLRKVPAPDVGEHGEQRTVQLNAHNGVNANQMNRRIRTVLKDELPKVAALIATEQELKRRVRRGTAAKMDLTAVREEKRRAARVLREQLGARHRPPTTSKRVIGFITNKGILLAEAGLAFAGAYTILPRLHGESFLALVLKAAPFGFAIGVCVAAYGALETGGIALAEVLQRERSGGSVAVERSLHKFDDIDHGPLTTRRHNDTTEGDPAPS